MIVAMAIFTYDQLSGMDDEAFKAAIQLDPNFLTQFDQNGQTPLHEAIFRADFTSVKRLIQYGASFDQTNIHGISALMTAQSIYHKNNKKKHGIAQYLVQQVTDFSIAFPSISDVKEELLRYLHRRFIQDLSFWWCPLLLVGIGIGISGILAAASSLTFLSGLYASLWIAFSVTLLCLCESMNDIIDHMRYFYTRSEGYINDQQDDFLRAIRTGNFDTIDTILKENINWLFAPITRTFSRDSAMQQLSKFDTGRAYLIKKMSAIMRNEAAFNHLFNSEKHQVLLTQHPVLLRAAIDVIPITLIASHQPLLFKAFLDNIDFFREEAQQSINMLSKLTAGGLWIYENTSCSFINNVLHTSKIDSPVVHYSLANIALRGLYGESVNVVKAREHFRQVSRKDITLYMMAQKELTFMSLMEVGISEQTEARKKTETDITPFWIRNESEQEKKQRVTQFFQGLSHASHVLEIQAHPLNHNRRSIQEAVRTFLFDELSIDSYSDTIYDDGVKTESLDWTAEQGDTLIEIAAKLGLWDLVSKIFTSSRTSTDDKQYIKLLLKAVVTQNEAIVNLLVEDAAFDRIVTLDSQTDHGIFHEAVRVGNRPILQSLLKSEAILFLKKNDITPIHLSAMMRRWDFVQAIANKYPARSDGSDQYYAALLHAVTKKRADVISLLIKQGALDSKISGVCNSSCNTPCHEAIRLGDEGILKQLLVSHHDLDYQNSTGETPIVFAAELGRWDLVDAIATTHATTEGDPYHYNKALFLAIQAEQTGVVLNLIHQGACRDRLYQDPVTKDTIWHAVVQTKNLELLTVLLKQAPPSGLCVKNKHYEYPMLFAAKEGNWLLVDAILKAPSTRETIDSYQYARVLFLAFQDNQVDIAHELLRDNAIRYFLDVGMDEQKNTLLHVAIKLGDLDLFSTLMKQTQLPIQCLYENLNNHGESPFALSAKLGKLDLLGLIVHAYPNPKFEAFRFFNPSNKLTQSDATESATAVSFTS